MKLSDKHEARVAELRAAKAEIESDKEDAIAALKAQIAAVERDAAQRLAAVEKADAAKRAELGAALTTALHSELDPLVASFVEDPSRPKAGRIAAVWASFSARARLELGVELWTLHLALAFGVLAIARHPAAVNNLGSSAGMTAGPTGKGLVDLAFRASMDAVDIAAFDSALRAIESGVNRLANEATGEPADHLRRRFELARSCVSAGDSDLKLEAFDRALTAEHNEAFRARYRPPEGARIAN